jgi:hypothetical protein
MFVVLRTLVYVTSRSTAHSTPPGLVMRAPRHYKHSTPPGLASQPPWYYKHPTPPGLKMSNSSALRLTCRMAE